MCPEYLRRPPPRTPAHAHTIAVSKDVRFGKGPSPLRSRPLDFISKSSLWSCPHAMAAGSNMTRTTRRRLLFGGAALGLAATTGAAAPLHADLELLAPAQLDRLRRRVRCGETAAAKLSRIPWRGSAEDTRAVKRLRAGFALRRAVHERIRSGTRLTLISQKASRPRRVSVAGTIMEPDYGRGRHHISLPHLASAGG
jgi:hypothetical protein